MGSRWPLLRQSCGRCERERRGSARPTSLVVSFHSAPELLHPWPASAGPQTPDPRPNGHLSQVKTLNLGFHLLFTSDLGLIITFSPISFIYKVGLWG